MRAARRAGIQLARSATPITKIATNAARPRVPAGGSFPSTAEITRTLTALGGDVFLANIHLSGVDDARLRATLTRYAGEVVPRVRAAITRV